jgi:hypothetical protein
MATPETRSVRLCLKDLYHQDMVEMIERETRKYELWTVEHPDDPAVQASLRPVVERLRRSGGDGAGGSRARRSGARRLCPDAVRNFHPLLREALEAFADFVTRAAKALDAP